MCRMWIRVGWYGKWRGNNKPEGKGFRMDRKVKCKDAQYKGRGELLAGGVLWLVCASGAASDCDGVARAKEGVAALWAAAKWGGHGMEATSDR